MNAAVYPSALLVLDVFSAFDFPGGEELYGQARQITQPLHDLCSRYRQAGQPVIFINDNLARWQDSFDDLLGRVASSGAKGKAMVEMLHPNPFDYRLLKPRHSGFFETSLPSLLSHLDVKRVVVAGLAADSCVLCTVMDAHVRGFESVVSLDTTAAQTTERTARVLAHLRESCSIETPPSADVVP